MPPSLNGFNHPPSNPPRRPPPPVHSLSHSSHSSSMSSASSSVTHGRHADGHQQQHHHHQHQHHQAATLESSSSTAMHPYDRLRRTQSTRTSSSKNEEWGEAEPSTQQSVDDPTLLRRREANRLAAQRFRNRKKGYQDSLEEKVRDLQDKNSELLRRLDQIDEHPRLSRSQSSPNHRTRHAGDPYPYPPHYASQGSSSNLATPTIAEAEMRIESLEAANRHLQKELKEMVDETDRLRMLLHKENPLRYPRHPPPPPPGPSPGPSPREGVSIYFACHPSCPNHYGSGRCYPPPSNPYQIPMTGSVVPSRLSHSMSMHHRRSSPPPPSASQHRHQLSRSPPSSYPYHYGPPPLQQSQGPSSHQPRSADSAAASSRSGIQLPPIRLPSPSSSGPPSSSISHENRPFHYPLPSPPSANPMIPPSWPHPPPHPPAYEHGRPYYPSVHDRR